MLDFQNIKNILVIKDKQEHIEYIAKYSEYLTESDLVIDFETFNSIQTEEHEIWKGIFEMDGKFFRRTDSRKNFALYVNVGKYITTGSYGIESNNFVTIHDFMPIPTNFYFKK